MASSLVFAIVLIICVLIIVAVIMFTNRETVVVVYGSKTCPWCVKQEKYLTEKGVPYRFVECDGGCPSFVNGFPTLVVDGQVHNGYTEL